MFFLSGHETASSTGKHKITEATLSSVTTGAEMTTIATDHQVAGEAAPTVGTAPIRETVAENNTESTSEGTFKDITTEEITLAMATAADFRTAAS